MKSNIIKPLSTLAIAAVFALCASCAQTQVKEKQNPALLAKAKVSQADAEKTALKKAPDGTVKESELKEKKGKLVWSVEMTRPKTTKVTEVKIDAVTGKVLKVEVEDPNKEKVKGKGKEKEEKEDTQKAKQ